MMFSGTLPTSLQPAHFAAYPSQARELALAHLPALRQLPLSFLPSLLREVIDYDYKFPAERTALDRELTWLSTLSQPEIAAAFQPFQQLSLTDKLQSLDWVNHPSLFLEQQSAHLWSTHQLDAFRQAATGYGDRLQKALPPLPLPARRLGIAVIGQGVASYSAPLFRKLREHGTYFTAVDPENGLSALLAGLAARAQAHPAPYAHWYVDGGPPAQRNPAYTSVSYQALEPLRVTLLKHIDEQIARPGMGPEELRTDLARLSPSDLAANLQKNATPDPVLARFQLRLFTEGSGTQIFSTTFAQWTAREALRRAQPLTLLVRFAPRQRQRPMNELLSSSQANAELDPTGSLIDADMAAYYQWLNQQRLPGADQSAFLVWFEGHNQALAIGPSLPRGAQSTSAIHLEKLLSLVTT